MSNGMEVRMRRAIIAHALSGQVLMISCSIRALLVFLVLQIHIDGEFLSCRRECLCVGVFDIDGMCRFIGANFTLTHISFGVYCGEWVMATFQ